MSADMFVFLTYFWKNNFATLLSLDQFKQKFINPTVRNLR